MASRVSPAVITIVTVSQSDGDWRSVMTKLADPRPVIIPAHIHSQGLGLGVCS